MRGVCAVRIVLDVRVKLEASALVPAVDGLIDETFLLR